MFEEGTMEKKSVARQNTPAKVFVGESKKSENGYSGKFSRTPKKREPNGRVSLDTNPSRKPMPQKCRMVSDKRPRARGYFNDKQRDAVTEQIGAELDFARFQGTNLRNLNHLLNFTCQFVVKADGDYSIHAVDPDELVDWELVEQVRMYTPELPSCPICLQQPIVGKITRCGHVYCWACILHYLVLSEKTWNKCPICHEDIDKADLKSVQTIEADHYKIGETITMCLMRKDRGRTLAVPVAQWSDQQHVPLNVMDPVNTRYAKLLTASPAQIQDLVIEAENIQLTNQMKDAEVSEVCFIESAMALQKERENSLKTSCEATEKLQKNLEKLSLSTKIKERCGGGSKVSGLVSKIYASAFSDEEETASTQTTSQNPEMDPTCLTELTGVILGAECGCHSEIKSPPVFQCAINSEAKVMPAAEAAEHLELPQESGSKTCHQKNHSQGKDVFHFYQAIDGQHIYLHAVNVKCLVKEYGSLENCPHTITATIIELESVFMSEELRKRLRYLNHLPLISEFRVAELALKAPIVSKETLRYFADDLERRRRIRQKKNRDDRRRAKKIQEEENMKFGIYPALKIPLSSQVHFPAYNLATAEMPQNDAIFSASALPMDSSPLESHCTGPSASHQERDTDGPPSGMSFAQMLKAGKARQAVGVSSVQQSFEEKLSTKSQRNESDSDNEDKAAVPDFQDSFGNAIQTVLENLEKNKDGEQEKKEVHGKKKKKKQKTLLFTTAMARGK